METLNLTKGQSLDLKKADGSAISKIRVGLSWDVSAGKSMDLDLFVVNKAGVNKTVAYFGNKTAIAGVKLSDDNLTGAGDGDDEFANFDATQTSDGDYYVCLNIYNAAGKGQAFKDVNSAKVTVYDVDSNAQLATYNITEAGGSSDSLIVGKITDSGNAYTFTALGNFINWDINVVSQTL